MKRMGIAVICIISVFVLFAVAITGPAIAQGGVNFAFEHQDPAGDVLKFNITLNGTASEDFEGLDLKWLYSERIGDDLVITTDLKAKEKFRIENGTKYVYRILTSSDNSTGYNITYRNGTATMNSFAQGANGTSIDITENVTFIRDKGNENMEIKVSILTYLDNITHYGLDAYSMKVTHNATYLDYISELPGHPEYVNPDLPEDLPTNGGGDDDDDGEESNMFLICAVLGVIIFILAAIVVIIVVVLLLRKKKAEEPEKKKTKEPEKKKKSGGKPRPPPPPPDD